MVCSFLKFILLILVLPASSLVFAQVDVSLSSPSDRAKRADDEMRTKTIGEMLVKQRILKEKKVYAEMLKRGEEALTLSKQLENSFDETKNVSDMDKQKLGALEKIVTKIRKELGGDDIDDNEEISEAPTASRPSTLKEAFLYLQSTTVKLVDELKKSTRFSISVTAIQSTNTVLKLVRFLRLRN